MAIMSVYALWNLMLGIAIFVWQGRAYLGSGRHDSEVLFSFAIALFHMIFAIWFFKGRALAAFIGASVVARLFSALAYAAVLAVFLTAEALPVSEQTRHFFIRYLALQGTIDLVSATLTGFMKKPGVAFANMTPQSRLPYINRFLFACYMALLSLWIFFATQGFLAFFRLPATQFGMTQAGGFIPGPLHIFAILVLILAFYNFVAVRHKLQALIEAGSRGGLFTCIFVTILVLAGVFHPLVLLLPLVDFISVGILLLAKVVR